MLNSTDRMANEKAERDAAAKAARRAEEASIVAGLRGVLQADEQLLGFARARIAGGIKGRLNIGPEAFFAPFVNIGLTERRFIIQHLHGETARPSEILPHFFAIADIQSIHFADIETYGGTPASRLVLHLANGQSFRLRLTGENNFDSSKSLAEVFRSLTSVRKNASGPTQRVCVSCRHIMDRPSKFCPYCGTSQMDSETSGSEQSTTAGDVPAEPTSDVEKVTVVTESHTDLLDDALAFLRNEPAEPPKATPEPAVEAPSAVSDQSDAAAPTDLAVDAEPIAAAPNSSDALESTFESAPLPTDSAVDATEPNADALTSSETTDSSFESAPLPAESIADAEPAATVSNTVDASEPAPEPAHEASFVESAVDVPAPTNTFPDFSAPAHWQEPELPSEAAPEPHASAESAAGQSETVETAASIEDPQPVAEEGPASVLPETNPAPIAYADGTTPPVASVSTEEAASPLTDFTPSASTYSEGGSSVASAIPREEAPQMPANSAPKPLRVHFHIKHPAVQFDEVIIGRDADDVVSKLKDRVVAELKFPIKLAAMRLTPLEFAQEIVSKYNQEERQALPRPNSCREFLHLVQAIGYATVDEV